jgi:hypothetical protein
LNVNHSMDLVRSRWMNKLINEKLERRVDFQFEATPLVKVLKSSTLGSGDAGVPI